MNPQVLLSQIVALAINYGPRFIGAILVFFIGLRIIDMMNNTMGKMMQKSKIDLTLQPFIKSISVAILKVLLVLSVLGMVGVEVTSFIAILGAAGLAVGMALSGTLQNFAGGVVILILKPFKVNDLIEAQGFIGVVKEIQIFSTILQTADNKIIYIPNGGLSTASMTNYSTQPDRRVDLVFNIAYGQQVEMARDVLFQIVRSDSRILNSPAEPFIAVSEITDSTVKLVVRVWTRSENYWGVYFDMNEKVYNAFLSEGLTSRPVPQMNVSLNK